jgi:hypothetical protein
MAIKRIRIYDMDGTIVCSLHRYRTMVREDGKEVIDLAYWRENEKLAYNDGFLPLVETYRADLADPECFTIIATARVLNGPDYAFIADKLGMPDHIISRKDGDTRSGGTLKVLGLRRLLSLCQFQGISDMVFFEDNKDYLTTVVDAFFDRGMRGVYIPSKQGH